MSQLPREEPGPFLERVGLFVDYESLRFGLDDAYGAAEDDRTLPGHLRSVAERYGRVIVANVYGDWTRASSMALPFRQARIRPVLALNPDGEDRADLSMALDILETLAEGPELDVFVLATDSADYDEVAERLRRADRLVIVVALDADVSSRLRRAADGFVSLEPLLGLDPDRPLKSLDLTSYDWGPIIELVADLEEVHGALDMAWLISDGLDTEMPGCRTTHERRQLIGRALEDGLLTAQEDSEVGRDAPRTLLRLNREHDRVKDLINA